MARPRKRKTGAQFTPGQAAYVLNRMIADKRVSAGDVNRYVSDMSREISALERQLAALRAAHGAGAAAAPAAPAPARRRRGRGRKAAAAAPAKRAGRKRSKAITPEQQASRKLQGRYLGLVRQFPPAKRAYYAKVAREKGREAAIKEMLDSRK